MLLASRGGMARGSPFPGCFWVGVSTRRGSRKSPQPAPGMQAGPQACLLPLLPYLWAGPEEEESALWAEN